MSIATVVCGVWSLTRIFSVVLAGGVGKNGSTVAVSLLKENTTTRTENQKKKYVKNQKNQT